MSTFEGPMGLELLREFRVAMQAETPKTRYKVYKCAKVRTSLKTFGVLRRAAISTSNTSFIKSFMKNHWVEIKSLSDTDKGAIVIIYESIEKERFDNMQANDSFHDGGHY
jgi:hypothetical protein